MSIVLTVLAFVGKLLLILLCVILVLVFLLLFYPISYRVSSAFDEPQNKKFTATVKVTWLLHLVSFGLTYSKDKMRMLLRVCGIPIWQSPKKQKKKKPKVKYSKSDSQNASREKDDEKKDSSVEAKSVIEKAEKDGKNISQIRAESIIKKDEKAEKIVTCDSGMIEEDAQKANDANKKEATSSKNIDKNKKEEKKTGKNKNKKNTQKGNTSEIGKKFAEIWSVVRDERNQNAVKQILFEVWKLLLHYRPRKCKIDVEFGMEDPAATGKIVGAMAMLPFVYQKNNRICPDFETESTYAKGTVELSGRVQLIFILILVLRLLKQKDVKRLVTVIKG
jgi:hypothetical protein